MQLINSHYSNDNKSLTKTMMYNLFNGSGFSCCSYIYRPKEGAATKSCSHPELKSIQRRSIESEGLDNMAADNIASTTTNEINLI